MSICVIFQRSQAAQIYKQLTKDSINNTVSCIDLILFGKFLSVDVVLKQCDQKKSPNVYKSCPKMISIGK